MVTSAKNVRKIVHKKVHVLNKFPKKITKNKIVKKKTMKDTRCTYKNNVLNQSVNASIRAIAVTSRPRQKSTSRLRPRAWRFRRSPAVASRWPRFGPVPCGGHGRP